MSSIQQTLTITFGEVTESHAGMKSNGIRAESGFSIDDFFLMKEKFSNVVIYDLTNGDDKLPPATVLVAKGGLNDILGGSQELMKEITSLDFDTKAWMKGKVVNKRARFNLCFGDSNVEPNYEEKIGRIVDFSSVPLLKFLRIKLADFCGEKAKNLFAEANLYYDINKCGIGYHGDSERRRVIGVRMGSSLPLYFQWYYKGERVSERLKINLEDSDIYIMSEKAVGTDWKRRSLYTLRHATGCSKYTD